MYKHKNAREVLFGDLSHMKCEYVSFEAPYNRRRGCSCT